MLVNKMKMYSCQTDYGTDLEIQEFQSSGFSKIGITELQKERIDKQCILCNPMAQKLAK